MITFIIIFIVFLLILSLWGFYSAIYPYKILSSNTPADYNLKYENVSFRTKDNVLIHGWYFPNRDPNAKTIILLHGYPADKGNILASRIFLHQHYNLLFFDFRYMGSSEGKYSSVGKNEILDLLAAIDYLDHRGIHEIGVWGLSMGGAIALMTAGETKKIKAMVIESAYARLDWMLDGYYRVPFLKYPLAQLTRLWAWIFLGGDIADVSPLKAAEKLKIPILFIYSKSDTVVPFKHGLALQQAMQHNSQAKFMFVEDISHGETIADYQKLIGDFFDKNL